MRMKTTVPNTKQKCDLAREFLSQRGYTLISSEETHPYQIKCLVQDKTAHVFHIFIHFYSEPWRAFNMYAQLPGKESWAYCPDLEVDEDY